MTIRLLVLCCAFLCGCCFEGRPPAAHDSAEKMIRKLVEEVWNTHNVDVLQKFYTDDVVYTSPASGYRTGIAELKAYVASVISGYPDIQISIQDVWINTNETFMRCTLSGTNSGDLRGAPPTFRTVSYDFFSHAHFRDGKIDTEFVYYDFLDVHRQLGFELTMSRN